MINIVFENNGTNIYMDFQMPYLPELLLQTPPKEDNAIFVEIRLIGVKNDIYENKRDVLITSIFQLNRLVISIILKVKIIWI